MSSSAPSNVFFRWQYEWRIRPTRLHFASASLTLCAPSVTAHYLQGTIPSLEPRARVSARSHEPVPPRNIPPEPASWENLAIRANNRHLTNVTSAYHLHGCHWPGTSAPVEPEAKSQCLRTMSQCHNLGSTLHLQGRIKPLTISKGGNPQRSRQTNYLHYSIFYFTTYNLNGKR